jgi:predicted patatin/cPLA2 family phospholipase
LVIQPKEPVQVDRLEKDKEKLQKLYDEGYNDALERIEEIKAFINNN